jgi:uncharacterized protein
MEKEPPVRPTPLICEVLSGYLTLIVIGLAYGLAHRNAITALLQSTPAILAGFAAASFVVAWIVGTFLDSCGDLTEWLIDLWRPLNWNYMTTATADELERLNSWHYAYYSLARNYVVAGVLTLFLLLAPHFLALPPAGIVALLVFVAVSAAEALTLRSEIRNIMGTGMPHERVFARLQKSPIHGVGVFALLDIKKGTYVFEPDDAHTVQIPTARVNELAPELRRLYYDFGVLSEGKYEVPTSFNKLTISWYPNNAPERTEPNIAPKEPKDLRFYALRDIRKGEELTTRYGDYSESPPEE